jgi:hypothetical protein
LQNDKYKQSLGRLLKGDSQLGLAFAPPPANMDHDRGYWKAHQVPTDEWEATGCDFAMVIRRPRSRRDPGLDVRNHPITAFDTYDEANKS